MKTLKQFIKKLNMKYPPNVFTEYVDENHMYSIRGVAETTYIRRMTSDEERVLNFIDELVYER